MLVNTQRIIAYTLTTFLATSTISAPIPHGCEVKGFTYTDNYLVLNEHGDQAFYLLQNHSNKPIEMELYETKDVFMSPKLHSKLDPSNWSAFASDVMDLHFKCYTRDGENINPLNCSDVLDVCEYPRVKFALSNMGNYWVSTNKEQGQVIKDAVAKGILLRWWCMKKNAQATIFLSIGILGALGILYGLTQTTTQLYFVIGSALLMSTAMYFQLTYFVALELILMAGHGAIMLGIGPVLQVVLPILLCLQLLIYYLLSGRLENIFRLIGISGIALLSIGFAYANQWIFFFGSTAVVIFALRQVYEGQRIALLWVMLNTVFALIAATKLIVADLIWFFGEFYD